MSRGVRSHPRCADWDKAVEAWKQLHSDADAQFDEVVVLDGAEIEPQVTWGTSPEMVVGVAAQVPDPAQEADPVKQSRESSARWSTWG